VFDKAEMLRLFDEEKVPLDEIARRFKLPPDLAGKMIAGERHRNNQVFEAPQAPEVRIAVFECCDPSMVPANSRFQAFIMYPSMEPAKRKKGVWDFDCVRVSGATEAEAREACLRFWNNEVEKARENSSAGRGRPKNTIVSESLLTHLDSF
jgi:hypothetical protein